MEKAYEKANNTKILLRRGKVEKEWKYKAIKKKKNKTLKMHIERKETKSQKIKKSKKKQKKF